MLYHLPLEILDIILQKSYQHAIFNSPIMQRDEEVIRSLISVDVCFNRRITRQRFRKAIWRYLKAFYGRTKKRYAITRNNRNYILENIQPNDELIASLLSLNCITEEQRQCIQGLRSNRRRNTELWNFLRSCDDTKFSHFVGCLRQFNQKTVARIIEDGGVVLKLKVHNRGEKFSMETHLIHEQLEGLRNKAKPWSYQTDKLFSQLNQEGIDLLSSQLDRQTVVVWICCHSKAALVNMQKPYEYKQLINILFRLANIRPSTSEAIQSMAVDIDINQLQKTLVVCPISANFTGGIDIPAGVYVQGVTKLLNKIYVLCRSLSQEIRVFEDRIPFRHHKNIDIKEIPDPQDIVSSGKENCIYIPNYGDTCKCVWRITVGTEDENEIINWLTIDCDPMNLSVSNNGQLLMIDADISSSLMIYGSDAELIRSIKLPRYIEYPRHAVATSIGTFIIIHKWGEAGKEGDDNVSCLRDFAMTWCISELTGDGQMAVRRFISNETQQLNAPQYLSFDSGDRVFVSDVLWSEMVIFLDSDLRWNQILCLTEEEKQEIKVRPPLKFYYDEGNKQLIVGGKVINIYTLSRN